MAEVYAAAERRASDEFPSVLKPGQRGWVKTKGGGG